MGKCLPIEKKCQDEHSCGQKPRETTDASHCPERQCSASECEKCTATGKCIWTRQILRSSEWSFQLHSQPVYDWNCVRKTILDTKPSFSVSSSPPETCPEPCISHQTCLSCLESKGGSEGGYQECHWSMALNRCLSPAHKWLFCFGGVCGSILRGMSSNCPKPCSVHKSCSSCLEAPDCGWCATLGKNGAGECMRGNSLRSENNSGECPRFNWNYLTCPKENECLNGHHKYVLLHYLFLGPNIYLNISDVIWNRRIALTLKMGSDVNVEMDIARFATLVFPFVLRGVFTATAWLRINVAVILDLSAATGEFN